MISYRTEPNIMIAFSAPFEETAEFHQNFSHALFILSHYLSTRSSLSAMKLRSQKSALMSFMSISSGTIYFTFSISASHDPDSRARPGRSSLVATQTHASLSQSSLTLHCILFTFQIIIPRLVVD